MANPAAASVYGVGTSIANGYPVFATSDGTTLVTPSGQYVWSGTAWIPAAANASGNPLVVLTGSNVPDAQKIPVKILSTAGVEPTISTAITSDGLSNRSVLEVLNYSYVFDDTNWNRQRGNTQGTLLASAARTVTINSPNQTNYNAKGLKLILNITASSGTGGLSVELREVDPVSGNHIKLLVATAAIIGVGTYAYELYPGATTAGVAGTQNVQQRVAGSLGRTWAVYVFPVDASSYTYSLGYSLTL